MKKLVILAVVLVATVVASTSASFAQSQGSPASASSAMQSQGSAGSNGNQSYSTGMQAQQLQGYQLYQGQTNGIQAPTTLPQTTQNTMAPNSVNMAPVPSGTFSYGFPNTGLTQYMGVSQRLPSGSMLPMTGTSSVELNTCSMPFLAIPNDGNANPGSSMGALNLIAPAAAALTGGGNTANTNASTGQSLQSLQQYFNQP